MSQDFQSPPFSTQNQQLAFALMLSGCRFAGFDQGGPAQNVYTLGFLRSRKIGVGKDIEAAAMLAVEANIPGIVTYFFERSENLETAIHAWDAMVEEFQLAKEHDQAPVIPAVSTETVMQVLFVRANSVKEFQALPFVRTPLVSTVESHTKNEPIGSLPGTRAVTSGSGKVWSLGASKELKKHLKIA